MRTIKLTMAYDGTAYQGFQSQPSKITIQDKVEEAVLKLTGMPHHIEASGRTDAGVHARAQVAHLVTDSVIPIDRWPLALNVRLPHDIRVTQAEEMDNGFHARYNAKRKTYRYTLNTNRHPDVFLRHIQAHHPGRLDLDAMEQALSAILGEHDFSSFCSIHSTKRTHIRTIHEARMIRETDVQGNLTGVIHFLITGNGFLYNMVRIIVGTLLRIGEGKLEAKAMKDILVAKNRAKAGPTAVAQGLMLWSVDYE